ncbi:DUF2490 domain-containing protein [Tamlana sp. 2_MG-2023]|uniref:DUF2490 domain-containing protein n=1 Tax=unclassified Tamlana TaxID=2614803 RepID=UPI0026E1A8F1|nr:MULTISPECIES: DUF2490 domain-containing protein [unclassified Tamlana]MDO6759712.1 DUF2490 domain-containing protein [Tamlana sp. 2_MG-2023]MDO6791335.1 DUF2490 domain-containing protein [Tamlana sp. 1_MG-2023]
MKKYLLLITVSILCLCPKNGNAQIDESAMGAWYMYFFDTTFNASSWGVQGDVQYRNWNMGGDLEQLLLRAGVTYKPKQADIKFTLGYGHITTGTYGDIDDTTQESRIYQEALFPVKFGKRFYTNHRFRFEQRFVENQDFRTRYRYNLFLNIPLNKAVLEKNSIYLAFYNELFINGQRDIGNGIDVEIFDRNRFYSAVGYMIKDNLKVQLGVMNQTTNNWNKNQIQLSLHHKI